MEEIFIIFQFQGYARIRNFTTLSWTVTRFAIAVETFGRVAFALESIRQIAANCVCVTIMGTQGTLIYRLVTIVTTSCKTSITGTCIPGKGVTAFSVGTTFVGAIGTLIDFRHTLETISVKSAVTVTNKDPVFLD